MLIRRLLGAIVAAALLLPAAPVGAAAATPVDYGVNLVSTDYWYTDSTFTAVGEVRNDTDVQVKKVTIRASTLAADGSVVATHVGDVWLPAGAPSTRSTSPISRRSCS